MSKPALFLETTIQIERIVGSNASQAALRNELAGYRLVTSAYVLGEYLRTLVKDAAQLHHIITRQTSLAGVMTYLGQHPNKRESSRMMLIFGALLRTTRTPETQFDVNTRLGLLDRLSRYLEISLTSQFMIDIVELIDSTHCGLASERPVLRDALPGSVPLYHLRSQCVRHIRECDLAEHLAEQWQPELRALAQGLAQETDPALMRIHQLIQQIIRNPILARGRNCTWYLGDMIIALELPSEIPLYTTNRRHFVPLLNILGKKLHSVEG